MSSYRVSSVPVPDTLSAYPPLVARLLTARGITTNEEADRFLNPDWERDTHDPLLMKGMERAVARINSAMEAGEHIALWSDYDMDGIPGAVLLHDLFEKLGYAHVTHYTPHRNRDGFGLNKNGLDALREAGVRLVLTIDCGIGDVELVRYAHNVGMDVIVTDHHLPHETLPPAHTILNPKQPGDAYPEPMLCGAGVAFKLAQALARHARESGNPLIPEGWEKWLLDMAGMATIADMVPLRGENRALAHFGITVLRKSRRPGLQALLKKARTDQRRLTEDDIGFTIAPRVNAASRMGHAKEAFELLTTNDPVFAEAQAGALDRINTERKTTVAVMKRDIKRRLAKLGEPKDVIVLGHPDWKPSLLGLVASGIAEEYQRPVFLWGREEGVIIKGSCRSDGKINIFSLMHEARDVFMEYGGHAYSGGFSLTDEAVHVLEEALLNAHAKMPREASATREADATLTLDEVTWDTYRAVASLAPFGEGNPKPLFLFENVTLVAFRMFGKGEEHLELSFSRADGSLVKAIAFFTKPSAFRTDLVAGATLTLVAHLEASYFRGRELRLRLVDIV